MREAPGSLCVLYSHLVILTIPLLVRSWVPGALGDVLIQLIVTVVF